MEKLKNELLELMEHRASMVARMQSFQEELNYTDGLIIKQKLRLADAILGDTFTARKEENNACNQ